MAHSTWTNNRLSSLHRPIIFNKNNTTLYKCQTFLTGTLGLLLIIQLARLVKFKMSLRLKEKKLGEVKFLFPKRMRLLSILVINKMIISIQAIIWLKVSLTVKPTTQAQQTKSTGLHLSLLNKGTKKKISTLDKLAQPSTLDKKILIIWFKKIWMRLPSLWREKVNLLFSRTKTSLSISMTCNYQHKLEVVLRDSKICLKSNYREEMLCHLLLQKWKESTIQNKDKTS